jgi:hypothetical protein
VGQIVRDDESRLDVHEGRQVKHGPGGRGDPNTVMDLDVLGQQQTAVLDYARFSTSRSLVRPTPVDDVECQPPQRSAVRREGRDVTEDQLAACLQLDGSAPRGVPLRAIQRHPGAGVDVCASPHPNQLSAPHCCGEGAVGPPLCDEVTPQLDRWGCGRLWR